MTRAYALALGAGTQAFTVGFGEALFGTGVVRTDLMMAGTWALNLAIAEGIIRRPPPVVGPERPARRPPGRAVVTPPATPRGRSYELRIGGHLDYPGRPGSTGLTLTDQTTAPPP